MKYVEQNILGRRDFCHLAVLSRIIIKETDIFNVKPRFGIKISTNIQKVELIKFFACDTERFLYRIS